MKAFYWIGIFSFLLIYSPNIQAQTTSIDKYFNQFKGDERFSRVNVSSRMFDLFMEVEMDSKEEQAFVETISKLEGLKVLMGEEVEGARKIYEEVVNRPANDMDELMTISDPNKEVRFYISESEGKISELLMIGFEEKQLIMMSLVGDINLKEIAALSKKMNIEGFDNFRNIDK